MNILNCQADAVLQEPLDSVFPLTDEQEGAVELIRDWFDKGDGGEFKLGGYAGTGKTTIINTVRHELRCSSIVAAFTGKAVNVLQRKGVSSQTLHSLMYDVHENEDGTIEFTKKLSLKDDPDLIIVDEASMISTELYLALKSFKVPLLFVGDPGQLEPVGDNPNLMAKPDFVLSKIHRQAEKSPIVRFATDIRLAKTEPRYGKLVPSVDYVNETELTVKPKVVSASEYFTADQIICAKNKTRTNLNQKIRAAKGYPGTVPTVGEKLICLRNNRQLGIFNGMLLFVRAIVSDGATYWLCNLEDEVGRKYSRIKVWKEPFLMPPRPRREGALPPRLLRLRLRDNLSQITRFRVGPRHRPRRVDAAHRLGHEAVAVHRDYKGGEEVNILCIIWALAQGPLRPTVAKSKQTIKQKPKQMSEEQVSDPILTNDLTDTAPDEPLIPQNEYNVTVVKMEDGSSERTGSKCVNIQLKHLGPVTAANGEVLMNHTNFMRIWITPTEKMTAEQIKRNLKKFQLACGIKSGSFTPYSQYVGKNLRVKIGFSKTSDEYPDQRNEVKSVVVP